MKTRRIWPLILAAAAIILMLILPVAADFGDYSSDYDYDYSYDYDWDDDDDWDYDWDDDDDDYSWDWSWDDDDDDDWKYTSGSTGSGSSGSSSGSSTGGDEDDSASLGLGILVLGGAAFALGRRFEKRKYGNRKPTAVTTNTVGVKQAAVRPIIEYGKLDPGFREDVMCEKLANLYVQMQNCWTAKDIEPLRPHFTDTFFSQMEKQLEVLARSHRTNYVERISVQDVRIRGFRQEGGNDVLVARLRTRIVDYTLDDSSGKLISGSREKEKFMMYEWTLTRKSGLVTGQTDGMQKIICPSCGAPLEINTSARCPYCGSVLAQTSSDWSLSAIQAISQTTAGKR